MLCDNKDVITCRRDCISTRKRRGSVNVFEFNIVLFMCTLLIFARAENNKIPISQAFTVGFLAQLSTDMDFYIISAELDFIPSTRLGFRRAVLEFLQCSIAFVADRVIKSGLKSQSNPSTMQRMRATICGREERGSQSQDCLQHFLC